MLNNADADVIQNPRLTCSYAHRMQSTKGHAPIDEVLQAAGVQTGVPNAPLLSPSNVVPSSSIQKVTYKLENPAILASSPKSRESHHPPEVAPGTASRKRTESLSEALGFSKSQTTPTGNVAKSSQQLQPSRIQSQHESRDRQINNVTSSVTPNHGQTNSRSSPSAARTREEENHWMQERQKGLQSRQEGKSTRHKVDALGRATTGGSQVQQPSRVTSGVGRGDVTMTESRSAPSTRPLDDEEWIVYKAESRRQQERPRNDASRGHRPVSRATSSNGHTASTYRR